MFTLYIKRSYKMFAKTIDFTEKQQRMATFGKVLSHPARIAIIEFLSKQQGCIVGDIAKEFPFLSRTTVSQHLQELKNIGIIQGDIQGVTICYCLNPTILTEMKELFSQLFTDVLSSNCQC